MNRTEFLDVGFGLLTGCLMNRTVFLDVVVVQKWIQRWLCRSYCVVGAVGISSGNIEIQ